MSDEGKHRADGTESAPESDDRPWPLSTDGTPAGQPIPHLIGDDTEADEEAEEEAEVAAAERYHGWRYLYKTRIRTSTVALIVALIGTSILYGYTSEYYGTAPPVPVRTTEPGRGEVWVTPSVTHPEPELTTTPPTTTDETDEDSGTQETTSPGTTTTTGTGGSFPWDQPGNQQQQQETTEVPSG